MKRNLLALLMAVIMLCTASLSLADTETPAEDIVDHLSFSLENVSKLFPGKVETIPNAGLSFYLPEGMAAAEYTEDEGKDKLVACYKYATGDSDMSIYVWCDDWNESYTNDAIIETLEEEIGECTAGIYILDGKEVIIGIGAADFVDEADEEHVYKVLALVSRFEDKIACIIAWGCGSEEEETLGGMIIESLNAIEVK